MASDTANYAKTLRVTKGGGGTRFAFLTLKKLLREKYWKGDEGKKKSEN